MGSKDKDVLVQLRDEMRSMNAKIEILNTMDERINKGFAENKKEFKKIGSEINKIVDRVGLMEAKMKSLEEKIVANERKYAEDDDIRSRLNNLIISGVPFKESENLHAIFGAISSQIGFESPPEASIFRFKGAGNDRPILVKFPSQYQKHKYLHNYLYKALSISAAKIPGYEKHKKRIYIQHDFSKQQYHINKAALQLKRNKKIKDVRVVEGMVGIIVEANSKIAVFYSLDEMHQTLNMWNNTSALNHS